MIAQAPLFADVQPLLFAEPEESISDYDIMTVWEWRGYGFIITNDEKENPHIKGIADGLSLYTYDQTDILENKDERTYRARQKWMDDYYQLLDVFDSIDTWSGLCMLD